MNWNLSVTIAYIAVLVLIVSILWIAKLKYPARVSQDATTCSQEPIIAPSKISEQPSMTKSFEVEEKDSLDKHLDMLTKSLAEKEGRLRISKSKFREKKKEIENLNTIDDCLKEKYDEIMENLRRDLATNEKECKKLQDRIEWVSQQRAELKEEIHDDSSVVDTGFFVAPATEDFDKIISCCCSKRQVRRNRLQSPSATQRPCGPTRSRSCISKQSGGIRKKDSKRRSSSMIECPYSDLILNIDEILTTMKMIESEPGNNACSRQAPKWMNRTSTTNSAMSGIPSTSQFPLRKQSCLKTCKQFPTSNISKAPVIQETVTCEKDNNAPLSSDVPKIEPKPLEKYTFEDKPTTSKDCPSLTSFLSSIKPCPCPAKSSKKSKEFATNPLESEIKPPTLEQQRSAPPPQIATSEALKAELEYIPSCPKDCFSKYFDQDGGFVNTSYKESSSRMTIDSSSHSFGRIVEEELKQLTPMKKRKVMIKILEQIED